MFDSTQNAYDAAKFLGSKGYNIFQKNNVIYIRAFYKFELVHVFFEYFDYSNIPIFSLSTSHYFCPTTFLAGGDGVSLYDWMVFNNFEPVEIRMIS